MSYTYLTLERAKKEVRKLQAYIQLVNYYEVDCTEKWVIKEYATCSSISKIIIKANKDGIVNNGFPLDKEFIVSVINGKPKDELHRIIRSTYRKKIKKTQKTP
ncbi:hypothetical protein [Bacillus sp. ISL-39]|uniref:hypothetical protein n=1 Tax=Bacillus sp. ISL-39 TaxID=2819124 RepID=UPI001BEA11AD|nr:hypothetical protein [Bacillus sp. ISL-39]MBT2636585.1 hypothetical protein [Bacillus sp. ISL-39]